MKKSILLVLVASVLSLAGRAQFTVSVTLQHTFTVVQVDSIIRSLLGNQAGAALNTRYGVKMYKVVYNTVDADSLPTIASGLLVVPQATPCEVPILSFEHTDIYRKSDAPSRYGFESMWFVGLAAGSIGNISLMPDGLGLGYGPGLHPFLHAQSMATSVIDMIRSVKEFVDTTGNSPNEQLFLAGLSEGASAALAAHQYIQKYFDSTMHVTATGGIAGYYDMSGTTLDSIVLSNNSYVNPSFLPYLLLGYDTAYHFFANDSDIMAYPYDSIIPPLFNGNNRGSTINTRMPSVPNQILRQDQLDSIINDSTNYFRLLLQKNDLYNWVPTSPVYLLYCIADEYVPYMNSIVAYNHFTQNGATLIDTFDIGAAYNHNECTQFSVLSAVSLINRLLHQPITSTITATNTTSNTTPNGTATVTDTLGDPPFTWLWSNGDTTAAITGLAAGTYYVTATDRAHCTKVDSVVVKLADGIADIALADINVYPNPTQGLLTIENLSTTEKIAQVQITDISGNAVNAPVLQHGNITVLNLGEEAKGIYFLSVRSVSGKELHKKVVLL